MSRRATTLVLQRRRRFEGAHVEVWPQLDEEPLPLEAQLAHFGPVEGVYPRVTLQGVTSANKKMIN